MRSGIGRLIGQDGDKVVAELFVLSKTCVVQLYPLDESAENVGQGTAWCFGSCPEKAPDVSALLHDQASAWRAVGLDVKLVASTPVA